MKAIKLFALSVMGLNMIVSIFYYNRILGVGGWFVSLVFAISAFYDEEIKDTR